MSNKKIVVESLVKTSLKNIWEKTQNPLQHTLWDIRFDSISYLDRDETKDFQELLYETKLGFGIKIAGKGRYLHNEEFKQSTFEFWSDDFKSLIKLGRGIWLYEQRGDDVYFKTVFDYSLNYGFWGGVLDKVFRPLFCYATEYSFESLRLWSEQKLAIHEISKSYPRFLWSFLKYLILGRRPGSNSFSWLGKGHPRESRILHSDRASHILLYDGVCNLCDSLVQFILKYDKQDFFSFASLQSAYGEDVLRKYNLPNDLDTFVYIRNGSSYTRSTAALFTLWDLGGWWKLSLIFLIVPPLIRDLIYKFISKNRYRFFGKKDFCLFSNSEIQSKFLD